MAGGLFDDQAAQYARYRPRYPEALLAFLAAAAPSRERAWDAGTGNGQAAVALAGFFDRVFATDISAPQLEQAQKHPRVEYRLCPAEKTALEAASIDLACAATAAHWFDLPAYYAEARRVLKPKGVLALFGYGAGRTGVEGIDALLKRFAGDILGPYWAAGATINWSGYRSIPFPFEELETPKFEIDTAWTVDDLLGYWDSWSSTQEFKRRRGVSPLVEIEADMRRAWGAGRRVMRFPLGIRLGRV